MQRLDMNYFASTTFFILFYGPLHTQYNCPGFLAQKCQRNILLTPVTNTDYNKYFIFKYGHLIVKNVIVF